MIVSRDTSGASYRPLPNLLHHLSHAVFAPLALSHVETAEADAGLTDTSDGRWVSVPHLEITHGRLRTGSGIGVGRGQSFDATNNASNAVALDKPFACTQPEQYSASLRFGLNMPPHSAQIAHDARRRFLL